MEMASAKRNSICHKLFTERRGGMPWSMLCHECWPHTDAKTKTTKSRDLNATTNGVWKEASNIPQSSPWTWKLCVRQWLMDVTRTGWTTEATATAFNGCCQWGLICRTLRNDEVKTVKQRWDQIQKHTNEGTGRWCNCHFELAVLYQDFKKHF